MATPKAASRVTVNRAIGPSLIKSHMLTDGGYNLYGIAYVDYLERISRLQCERPYVTPPDGPHGTNVSLVAHQLYRRLYAMYMDTVHGLTCDSSLPGYCYLDLYRDFDGAEASLKFAAVKLRPFPKLVEILEHGVDETRAKGFSLVAQPDGTYHVEKAGRGIGMGVILEAYNAHGPMVRGIDVQSRVGALSRVADRAIRSTVSLSHIMTLRRPVLFMRARDTFATLMPDALELRSGENVVSTHELQTDGRWYRTCIVKAGMAVTLDPDTYANTGKVTFGCTHSKVTLVARHDTRIKLISEQTVDDTEMRAYLGSLAWSSEMAEHFKHYAKPVKCNVKWYMDDISYGRWRSVRNFVDICEMALGGDLTSSVGHVTPTLDTLLTDPLNEMAAVRRSRHEVTVTRDLRVQYGGDHPTELTSFRRNCGQSCEIYVGDCLRIEDHEPSVCVLVSRFDIVVRRTNHNYDGTMEVSYRRGTLVPGVSGTILYDSEEGEYVEVSE